jgi:hypothetical protein
MQLSQSVLVMLGHALGPNQAARCGCDFSAKSLQLSALSHISTHIVRFQTSLWVITSGSPSIMLGSSSFCGRSGRGLVDLPRPGEPLRAEYDAMRTGEGGGIGGWRWVDVRMCEGAAVGTALYHGYW